MLSIKNSNILRNYLQWYLQNDQTLPILIWGSPGIGKSSIVKTLTNHFFMINFSTISSKEDLFGIAPDQTAIGNKTQALFPIKNYVDCVETAQSTDEPVVLFLDEINRNELTLSAVMGLITDRELGGLKLPDNVKIISAGNDQGNILHLDSASLSRYQHIRFEPTIQDWYDNSTFEHEWIQKAMAEFCKDKGNENLYQENDDQIISGRQLSNLDQDYTDGTLILTLLNLPRIPKFTDYLIGNLLRAYDEKLSMIYLVEIRNYNEDYIKQVADSLTDERDYMSIIDLMISISDDSIEERRLEILKQEVQKNGILSQQEQMDEV